MDMTRIDTIVQFTKNSATVWSDVNVPLPLGAIAIDTVNKVIKEGDGVNLFADLPVCLDYNFSGGTSGAIAPSPANDGAIAIADNQMYAPSSTKLSEVLSSIADMVALNATQNARAAALDSASLVEAVPAGTANDTIVVCQGGKYITGTMTIGQLISDLVANASSIGTIMHIDDIEWYYDRDLTSKVINPNNIIDNTTYWCKVTGWHDTAELRTVDFGVSSTTPGVSIKNGIDMSTDSILVSIYGGTVEDRFNSVVVDNNDDIICVGYTASEGAGGGSDGLIVKFDKDLNIMARKIIGGTGMDIFQKVVVDKVGNIIIVGKTSSGASGTTDAFIVKMNQALGILAQRVYSGAGLESFNSVAIDGSNNIICVGYTDSEGSGNNDGLVVKFDTNLAILYRKVIGNTNDDVIYDVAIDSANNIYIVGSTYTGTPAREAFIAKLDSSLNVILKKAHGRDFADIFFGIVIDNSNNIYCAGTSEYIADNQNAIITKYDTSLNVVASKLCGGASGVDAFRSVIINTAGNIVCVGYEGPNNQDFGNLITIFDADLNILMSKTHGTSGLFLGGDTDSYGNMVFVGTSEDYRLGITNAMVMRTPASIISSSITGDTYNVQIADNDLTASPSTLTTTTPTLNVANSALTLATSTIAIAESGLSLMKDTFVMYRPSDPTTIIAAIYSGNESGDRFNSSIVAPNGDIYAVGQTKISSLNRALIVKFTNNLLPVARKVYQGNYEEMFNAVAINSLGYVICAGTTYLNDSGNAEALIAKYDSGLNDIITHKTYGSGGADIFNDLTITDADNIICVGSTASEGAGVTDGLIVKFDDNLAILAKKAYGGTGIDVLEAVALDPSDNVVCVGYTASEGVGTSGLIMKLGASLNIIYRKYYTSTGNTGAYFTDVAVSSANFTYVVGYVVTASGNKALAVRLDTLFNITHAKAFSNVASEFSSIYHDGANSVIVAGRTDKEGAGQYDTLIMKLTDANFTITNKKLYGSVGNDSYADVVIDTANDEIVLAGYGTVDSVGSALLSKLPITLPSGTYTHKNIPHLVISDSSISVGDDANTLNNSNLTMVDSNLTLTNSSMTLSNATGSIVRDVTIMDAISNVFEVSLSGVTAGAVQAVTFNVVTKDGINQISKNITANVSPSSILVAMYGGTGNDYFNGVAFGSDGNIYACGTTTSAGNGNQGLIVKMDSNFTILAKKVYGGSNNETFVGITIDSTGNIFCCGNTSPGSYGLNDGVVVKFNSALAIVSQVVYGGSAEDLFIGITTDSTNNVIVVGATKSEGTGLYAGLIIKYSNTLSVLYRKIYGGTGDDYFYGVAVDASNNIYVAGYTTSEGTLASALVIKYDASLNILFKKIYGEAANDYYYGVKVDSTGNVFCIGYTTNTGTQDLLIVKYDSSLNVLDAKIYGGTGNDRCDKGIAIDSNDNIIVTGVTSSEGTGAIDALILKLDNNLNLIARKVVGGSGDDYFINTTVDNADNIICVGNSNSEGAGLIDALAIKFPAAIPDGSYTGSQLVNITIKDSYSTLSDITLTAATSNLTAATSALTSAAGTLTLADVTLTLEKEIFD